MKKTFLHILLIFFLFYNFNDFCYAQRNKKPTIEEVLPACDSVEKIKKSFEIEGQKNIDAINIIIQIEKATINTKVPNPATTSIKRIDSILLNSNFIKAFNTKDLKTKNQATIEKEEVSAKNFEAKKLELVCNTATFIHKQYLENPDKIKKLDYHYKFYNGRKTKDDNNESTKIDEAEKSLEQRIEALERGTGGWWQFFVYLGLISLLLFSIFNWNKIRMAALGAKDKLEEDIAQILIKQMQGKVDSSIHNRLNQNVILGIIQEAVDKAVRENTNSITKEDLDVLKWEILDYVNKKLQQNQHTRQDNYSPTTSDSYYKQPIRNQNDYNRRNEKSVSVSETGKRYYSSQANKNGLFYAAQFSENDDKSKLFIIQISRQNTNEAAFILNPNADPTMLRRAFNDPYTYLNSACIVKGSGSFNRLLTDTGKSGLALKENGNWRVEKKAIVTYQ